MSGVALDPTLVEPRAWSGIDTPPASGLLGPAVRDERLFGGALGVIAAPSLTPAEALRLKALIKERMIRCAREAGEKRVDLLEGVPLERYHEVADHIDHRTLLSKRGRILPKDIVDEILTMSLFDYVREAFGDDCYLSDEEQVGHQQVCMRIVRPNKREDVGSLHQDDWFWQHNSWPVPAGWGRIKIWIPVCVQPRHAGLLLAAGSHRMASPYKTEMQNGKLAFVPDGFDPGALDLRRWEGQAGHGVMFNYRTLHVGSLNRGTETRVSVEVTVMYRYRET
jgi:hypothetical protein